MGLLPEPRDYNPGVIAPARLLAATVLAPLGLSSSTITMSGPHDRCTPAPDAAVVGINGTDMHVALTVDCNARYVCSIPTSGRASRSAEAARNLVATGAEPLAVSDCLNFGNPERPEMMWQFEQAIAGIRMPAQLGLPVVSGNVSFYNETNGIEIPPRRSSGWSGSSIHPSR